MNHAIAIAGGLLFGALVALAKYIIIWRPYALGRADGIYGRMATSSGVNVLTLLLVFLLRNYWPYPFVSTIIAVAMALSIGSRLFSQQSVKGLGADTNKAPKEE